MSSGFQKVKVNLDGESRYALQRIDCNCNNCGFMERDLATFGLYSDVHKRLQYEEFMRERDLELSDGYIMRDKKVIDKALNKKFQFDKSKLLQYGLCKKYLKRVSFIPDTCQLETQHCFVHRKDYEAKEVN